MMAFRLAPFTSFLRIEVEVVERLCDEALEELSQKKCTAIMHSELLGRTDIGQPEIVRRRAEGQRGIIRAARERGNFG